MHFDIFSTGETDNSTALVAMEGDFTILALQCKTGSLANHVCGYRSDDQQHLKGCNDAFDGEFEVRGNQVRACCRPHHGVEGHPGSADTCAGGGVAGTVCDVVFALVSGNPRFKEGVERDSTEKHNEHNGRHENVHRPGKAEEDKLPAWWHQAQGAIGKADIPVRLGARGHW